MIKYTLREKAKVDIDNIWIYTRKTWSENQANDYFNIILDCIETTAQDPEIGQLYDHPELVYRKVKVKSHYVFYRTDSKTSIEVIRVLHEKMDIDSHLA